MNRGFGSDNHSGVHPDIFQSLVQANAGHAPSYGTDENTEKAIRLFQEHFGEKTQVFFVFNGTAANVLSLRALLSSYQSVLCSDVSHIQMDECGAPEFFAGCKLHALPSVQGKLQIETLKKSLIRKGDQHYSQAKVLSLTQPTELGTCYSIDELKSLIAWAHSEKLFVHIDGSRLSNAAVSLGVNFRELTTDLGVDIVSFGGTKNGLMMGEAVLILNPALGENFKYIRKQSAQLPSKTRFIACQFETYLSDDRWSQIARHACEKAEKLHRGLSAIRQLQITAPRHSNAVFVKIPKQWIKALREKYFFYVWDEKTFECRLMTSWDTTDSDIEGFLALAEQLSKDTSL